MSTTDRTVEIFDLEGVHYDHLDERNRALHYGDGLFETIAVRGGQPCFLHQHLQRLQAGATRLSIALPSIEFLQEKLKQFVSKSLAFTENEEQEGVVKLILSRGSGGHGYRPSDNPKPLVLLFWQAFRRRPQKIQGVKLTYCHTRLSHQPLLAGLKHLNRLEQVLAQSELLGTSYDEGLMLDYDDNVIEGTKSNFFLIDQNQNLVTSRLNRCGVLGIMRGLVLSYAKAYDILVTEKDLTRHELKKARSVFICNSLRMLVSVNDIAGQKYVSSPLVEEINRWVIEQGNVTS